MYKEMVFYDGSLDVYIYLYIHVTLLETRRRRKKRAELISRVVTGYNPSSISLTLLSLVFLLFKCVARVTRMPKNGGESDDMIEDNDVFVILWCHGARNFCVEQVLFSRYT